MKAIELRIGNYVLLDDKGIYQIDSGHDIDEIDSFPFDNPYCQGITLTEKWLLDFGFEKPAHSFIGDVFHLSEWDYHPNNWCVAMNKNNAIIFRRLKYVHQLQNLYFALTGEELTLKNKT